MWPTSSVTDVTTMKLGSSIEVMAGHFVVPNQTNEAKPVYELSKAELGEHHSQCVQVALLQRITKRHRQIRYQSLAEELQSMLHTRYSRTGVPLEFIDAQTEAVTLTLERSPLLKSLFFDYGYSKEAKQFVSIERPYLGPFKKN